MYNQQRRKLLVKKGSYEDLVIDPDFKEYIQSDSYLDNFAIVDQNYGTNSNFDVDGKEDTVLERKAPLLPDDRISEETDIVYRNKIEYATYTIRIKNTSGKKISGIDAVISEK